MYYNASENSNGYLCYVNIEGKLFKAVFYCIEANKRNIYDVFWKRKNFGKMENYLNEKKTFFILSLIVKYENVKNVRREDSCFFLSFFFSRKNKLIQDVNKFNCLLHSGLPDLTNLR